MFAARSPLGSPAAFRHAASHAIPFPSSPASPRFLPSPKVQSPIIHHPIPRRPAKYVQDGYFPYVPPPRYPPGPPQLPNPASRQAENNIAYFTDPSTARPRLNTRLSSIIGEALRENITAVESETQPRTGSIAPPTYSAHHMRQRGGTIWEGHPNSPRVKFRKPSTNPETVVEDVAVESDSVEAKPPKSEDADKRRRSVTFSDPVAGMASTMAEIHHGLSRLNIKEDKYTLNMKKDIRRQTPGVSETDRESYGF